MVVAENKKNVELHTKTCLIESQGHTKGQIQEDAVYHSVLDRIETGGRSIEGFKQV